MRSRQPILTNEDLERIRKISQVPFTPFRTITLDMTYSAHLGAAGMERSLDWLCSRAETVVLQGWNVIVLSDREMGPDRIAIPSLLATSAIHHHLIRKGLRTSVGIVVETGEPHEVHQFALLAGYGAEAINPYLAFETIEANLGELDKPISKDEAFHRYVKAIGKGLMKVMSKMGISTYQSYCGAQIFDAVGLKSDFVAKWFTGTHTAVEGVGLDEIAGETAERHRLAFADVPVLRDTLDVGGEYAYRIRGELHAWNPDTIADLQHAVRGNSQDKYRAFAKPAQRSVREADDDPGPVPPEGRERDRPRAHSARRGRGGEGDREALRHGRDVVRLDQPRGAHHARHRHEPDRRQVQYRRRRRGARPLQASAEWRQPALGHQAGRLRALRRDHGIPGQLRHDADQDGAGRQARRRRPASRPQGR